MNDPEQLKILRTIMKAGSYMAGSAIKRDPQVLLRILEACFADEKLIMGLEPSQQQKIKAVKIYNNHNS